MKKLGFIFVGIFLIIGLIEVGLTTGKDASLLLTLLFWIAIVQGCVALVAIADLAKGKWVAPLKKHLLSVHPMILLIAFAFLLLSRQMKIYHWTEEPHGLWLNAWFFILRNFTLLLISFFFARKFTVESLKESEKKSLWAALYLLSYVISQSLVAFDWVMSLEYPWSSTLFGGYFFIEATYVGIAMAGIFCYFILRKRSSADISLMKKTQRDVATFLFGFSLFWAGMFFAQFLTIWYGNIPEEVSFVAKRMHGSPVRELSFLVLADLFFIPFILLLSKKIKSMPLAVSLIALIIMLGLFTERLVFLLPAVSIQAHLVVIEFAVFLLIFILLVVNREHIVLQK